MSDLSYELGEMLYKHHGLEFSSAHSVAKAAAQFIADNKPKAAKRTALELVTEIDEAELAIRIMERALSMKRCEGKISRDLLAESEKLIVASGDDFPFRDMARIAVEYFRERIERAQSPS